MKNKGTVLITVGLVMIFMALVLTLYNMWDDTRSASESSEVLAQITEVVPEPVISQPEISVPEERPADYILNPDMDMPVIEIDGRKYIGTIAIPSLGIELPVHEEWSYPNLKKAPCCYSGTVYKNNFVICAHNYRSHFGSLKNLLYGDEVTFTDTQGNVFCFEVAEIEILQPAAIEEMISSDWDLSLFTCTVNGAARVTIRCRRTDFMS